MGGLIQAIIAGISAFVATNIDDILLLVLFFSQTDAIFRRRHVVVGQYLGFSLLILASLPGFFGGLIIPKPWIGLLGLMPIIVGVTQLIQPAQNPSEIQTIAAINPQTLRFPFLSFLASLLTPQTYRVAAITVANGGDNIGIYVPLFASSTGMQLVVILFTFFLLIGIWCILAGWLSGHRAVAPRLQKFAHSFVPFVLIGLGLFILIENQSYHLFWN
jgi:cadmium resistance transport/sequestration family protein